LTKAGWILPGIGGDDEVSNPARTVVGGHTWTVEVVLELPLEW
jgi:hypothetical protein